MSPASDRLMDLSRDATDYDAYAEGDPTLDDVDPAELAELADRIARVQSLPTADERNVAALALWHEMYGDDLVVL